MDLLTALRKPTSESTLGGIGVGQAYQDLLLWEHFLNEHPAKSLLELGTWKGGMSLFFALQCHVRSMRFATLDQAPCDRRASATIQVLGGECHVIDLFSGEGEALVGDLLRDLPKPLVLFCDNGNKREEYRRFASLLAPGDFVAVHDWGSEFGEEDRTPHLPMQLEDECVALESITRFFSI